MNFIEEIHNYIGRNNIAAAITKLDEVAPTEMKALVTGIKAQNNALNFQRISGTASHSQMQVSSAQLVQSILNLANEIASLSPGPKTILLVAANPEETPTLQLRTEMDRIRAIFRGSKEFIIKSLEYASRNDLVTALQKNAPAILHFSGHGVREGIYLLQENSNEKYLLPTRDLLDILLLNRSVQLTFLNSCFSLHQLRELRRGGINEMIGMPIEAMDAVALEFAEAFYRSIANGIPYNDAFNGVCQHEFISKLKGEEKPVWLEKL